MIQGVIMSMASNWYMDNLFYKDLWKAFEYTLTHRLEDNNKSCRRTASKSMTHDLDLKVAQVGRDGTA